MTTMPKGINWNEQFYKLLRLSLMPTDGNDCIRQPYASRSSVSAIMACACCQRAASRLTKQIDGRTLSDDFYIQ